MGTGNTRDVGRHLRLAALVCGASNIALSGLATAEDNSDGLQTVVVTAQKRVEIAQDVPLAVTVVSAQAIENAGDTSLTQIQNMTAGLQLPIPDSPLYSRAVIRGVTTLQGAQDSGSAIGLYLDEVPLSTYTQNFPLTSLMDVQRVEVLRGPQGTLFGDGSMGGTIRVITNKPDFQKFYGDATGRLYTTQGGGTGYDGASTLNIPFSDTFAVRMAVQWLNSPGWIDVPALDKTNTNGNQELDTRLMARWQPIDKLTVDVMYMYQNLDVYNQTLQTSPGVWDPKQVNPAAGDPHRLSTTQNTYNLENLTLTYDLGFADLVSATSVYNAHGRYSADNAPLAPLYFGLPGTSNEEDTWAPKFTTEELRLVSPGGGRLNWTAGLYYRHVDRYQSVYYPIDLYVGSVQVFSDLGVYDATTTSNSYSAFGQVEYKLTDRFSLTAGLRYFDDHRTFVTRELSDSVVFGLVKGTTYSVKGSDNDLSPEASLEYKINPSASVFARIAKGFRSGGNNPNSVFTASIPASYDPEQVWAYELGLKTEPAAGWTANAYLFYNDWKDLQLDFQTADGLHPYVDDAGKARSYGAEGELHFQPSRNLMLLGNVSYTKSELTQTVYDPFGVVRAQDGNRIPYVPEWQFGFDGDYRFPLVGRFDGFVHADYIYDTNTESEASNNPLLLNGDFQSLSLRLGVETSVWRADIYCDNVTNNTDETLKTAPNLTVYPTQIYSNYARPRTVGLEISAKF